MLAQKGNVQKADAQKYKVQKPLANARVRPDMGRVADGD
jgi:hypothetical protein